MNFKKYLALIFDKKNLIPLVVLMIVAGSVIGIFLYLKKGGGLDLNLNNSAKIDPVKEAERIMEEVGEIYLLPNEIPTLATVSDKNQLVDQIFFEKAEIGDKVLIYRTAGLAILYRPSMGKIINVGPVNLENGEIEGDTEEKKELEEARVLILNGTETVGLTVTAAEKLEDLSFVSISDRADAVNKPYTESVVVYLSEEFKPQAEIIASSLSAQVSTELEEGEDDDGADIVIILGEDYVAR